MNATIDTVFLDTNFFENENFYFKGHRLQKIGEFSKTGLIQVKITSITFLEVKNRIRENFKNAIGTIQKIEKLFEGEGKILKNLEEYKIYYPLVFLQLESSIDKLCNRFEDYIKNNKIEIVDAQNVNIHEILNKYFKTEKPFGKAGKKTEFPDAFILDAITNWCKINSKMVYLLSYDKDIIEYQCPNNLIVTNKETSEILEIYGKKQRDALIFELIRKQIFKTSVDVRNFLNYNYDDQILEKVYDRIDGNFEDCIITSSEYISLEYTDAYLIYVDEETATYDVEADITLNVTIDFEDYSNAWEDSEDQIWRGLKRIQHTITATISTRFEIEYLFELIETAIEKFEMEELRDFTIVDVDYEGDDSVY